MVDLSFSLSSLSIAILSCALRSISRFCSTRLKFSSLFLFLFMVMAMVISIFISALIIILWVYMLGWIVFVTRLELKLVRYSFLLIFTEYTTKSMIKIFLYTINTLILGLTGDYPCRFRQLISISLIEILNYLFSRRRAQWSRHLFCMGQ